MDKTAIRDRIEQVGIIPAVRAASADQAKFAVEAMMRGGILIAEITMTTPGAIEVISHFAHHSPDLIVGAGTILDVETAERCRDAGAKFLTSPGLVLDVVEFAVKNDVVVFPGALTPTEVITAWKAGSDFVKVFPCGQVGGDRYIRALKAPLPQVRLIASGGVNQQTAVSFILAGAAALGIGGELIPKDSLRLKEEERIHELARRFNAMVRDARHRKARAAQ